MTFLGLEVCGLILSLCTFFLEANSLSSLDSRLLRFFYGAVDFLKLQHHFINVFSIYSTLFIDWYFVEAGDDFALASGFPVANLFCNIWLKSSNVLSSGSSTRPVSGYQ